MGDPAVCDPSTATCPPPTSSQPVKGGLQEQWGLAEPQIGEAGSSEQAKKYTADFRAAMAPVGQCLQYTVSYAEKPKHDGMVAKRDQCYPAYQAVIPKIDPNDEEKAKNDIEQVLAKARGVAGEASQLKADTERALNAWKAKEPDYDKAVHQIEELEQWEDKAAPTLRSSATEIRTTANDRKYDDAVAKVDQLATNLKPVYEEYLRQKAAKEQYDPKLAALKPRLDQCQTSRFKKLESMVTEIATIKTDMETAAQSKDYVKALELIGGLEPKVDAYLKALEELERQKKAYEDALEPLKPKLSEASQSKFKKLEPMQQDMVQVQKDMEASAQNEEFDKALQQCNDLNAKVEAYNTALKEIEEKKKAYEQALEPLKPKLAEASQSKYKKLEPMQQDMAQVQKDMEASAQSEEFEKALQQCTDLGTKVDAYNTALKELEEKKKAYEDALEKLKPKLDEAGQKTYAKLDPQKKEYEGVKTEMETAAQGEEFEQALQKANDLTTKVDAYFAAVKDFEEKKKKYEDALEALKPKLGEASQSKYKKLEPMQQDMAQVQKDMEASAQAEDFEKALQQCTDLGAKVDAYNTALKELEEKKKKYDEAVEQLKPKLEEAGPKTYARLDAQKKAYESIKSEMETAAGAEDYDLALQKQGDLTAKVDDYLKVVKDLEEKKKQYDEKLEPLKSKLAEVSQSKYAKLQQSQQEIATLQTDMEAAAKEDDYEKALGKLSELSTKVEACSTALKELDEKKKKYDDELGKLKPKLEEAGQKNYEKLAPLKQELEPVKAQMEAAAQSEDFDQAVQRATDLTAKADAFLAAVKELEAKKTAYEQAYNEFKPKLTEASEVKNPDVAAAQSELKASWQQMDSAAAKGEYNQASNMLAELKKKVADIMAAKPKDGGGTGGEGDGSSKAKSGDPSDKRTDEEVKKELEARTGKSYNDLVLGLGRGPIQMSPRELEAELHANKTLKQRLPDNKPKGKQVVMDGVLVPHPTMPGRFITVAKVGTEEDIDQQKQGGQAAVDAHVVSGLMAGAAGIQPGAASKGIVAPSPHVGRAPSPAGTTGGGGTGGGGSGPPSGGPPSSGPPSSGTGKPVFPGGVTDSEMDSALKGAKPGTPSQLPGQNPTTGEGLKGTIVKNPDGTITVTNPKLKGDETKPIAHHDNMEFTGIKGAPDGKVEHRRHSANKDPKLAGKHSHDNPTTQVNTKKEYTTPDGKKATKYLLPDGSWKFISEMTEAERAAAHYE